MDHFQVIVGVLAGISTSITAAILYATGRRILFRVQTSFGSKRIVKSFLDRELRDFRGVYPSKIARLLRDPRHYVREETDFTEERKAPYLFFTRDNVELEEFKGMLIPPLDLGHGSLSQNNSASKPSLGMRFDENWKKYFRGLNYKINNQTTNPVKKAMRIVLIDKRILNLFIFHKEWIFETSQFSSSPTGEWQPSKTPEGIPEPLTELADGVIEYVHQVAEIHRLVIGSNSSIQTFYIDKSKVASDQYYDFGLYKIRGIPIVYNPIYEKRRGKRIIREKIFIGKSSRQLFGIKEYEEDFDNLWKTASRECNEQKALLQGNLPSNFFSNPNSHYFNKTDYMSVDFFEAGYNKQINKILNEHGVYVGLD